jgi:hypothetical protein
MNSSAGMEAHVGARAAGPLSPGSLPATALAAGPAAVQQASRLRSDVADALCASLRLPTFRPVEEDPDEEIVGKVLEAMGEPGGREEDIVRSESLSCFSMNEPTAAADDDIQLVLSVWLLRIGSARRVQLHAQRPMLEHERGPLTLRAGQATSDLLSDSAKSCCHASSIYQLPSPRSG